MNSNKNQILVALDGSDNALEAVRYVSKITSFRKMQAVLFHVYTKLPGFYRDREIHAEGHADPCGCWLPF